jgi:hypothetical protein
MATVEAAVDLPKARIAEAEGLWYELARWSAFVDGFGHVERTDGEWPETGSRVVWDSRPGGRGRVVERVTAYAPGAGQTVEVEDSQLTGTQRVEFVGRDDGCQLRVELSYELKARGFLGSAGNVVFVRPALRAAIRRTLARFARELAADRELGE